MKPWQTNHVIVRWWNETVGVREGAGSKSSADQRSTLSMDDAEKLTQIAQQQVSKWRKRAAGINIPEGL
jgi:hypothetical protein